MHFAGHAWFDDEAYLVLANEVKLHASEFRSLLSSTPPAILFLNTHYTLFMPPGAGGEDASPRGQTTGPRAVGHRGFLEAASTAGVGALIGTFSGGLDDLVAEP